MHRVGDQPALLVSEVLAGFRDRERETKHNAMEVAEA